MKYNLYKEINFSKNKSIFYKSKRYEIQLIKKEIDIKSKKLSKLKKGIISISVQDKIDFLVNFYACNKAGFPVYLNDNNSKYKINNEKININYILKKNEIIDIKNTFKKKYNYHFILKTSGSTSLPKYVLIKNQNISYICKNMNKEMFSNKKIFNELIFAPINHSFGFGRIHSLMISRNDFTLIDEITISNILKIKQIVKNINSLSIPAKILSIILEMGSKLSEKFLNKIKYIQVSTGYFPIKYRKKILNNKINLYINYGMTEAMRSTFLNCSKYKDKINTEGKPFIGTIIKIDKNHNKIGKIGKILVKGENLALGYENANDWKKRISSGYFDTGDIGSLDKENFLTYKSRAYNKLNINGTIYYCENIENQIKKKFKIKNAKVIQTKNEKSIYLIIDKKINDTKIYHYLKKNKVNLFFNKIIFYNFIYKGTGKINFAEVIKKNEQ